MQDSLDLQIRNGVMNYLADKVSLFQFLDTFVDMADEVDRIGDPELERLVNTIRHYWAELTGDYLTKEGFRDLLRPLVEPLIVPLEVGGLVRQQSSFRTSSESEIITNKLKVLEYQPTRVEEVVDFSPHSLVYDRSLVDNSQGYTREQLVI